MQHKFIECVIDQGIVLGVEKKEIIWFLPLRVQFEKMGEEGR